MERLTGLRSSFLSESNEGQKQVKTCSQSGGGGACSDQKEHFLLTVSFDLLSLQPLCQDLVKRKVDFARFAGKWRRQNDVGTVGKGTVLASEQRNLLISDFKSFPMGLKASWRKSSFQNIEKC